MRLYLLSVIFIWHLNIINSLLSLYRVYSIRAYPNSQHQCVFPDLFRFSCLALATRELRLYFLREKFHFARMAK